MIADGEEEKDGDDIYDNDNVIDQSENWWVSILNQLNDSWVETKQETRLPELFFF